MESSMIQWQRDSLRGVFQAGLVSCGCTTLQDKLIFYRSNNVIHSRNLNNVRYIKLLLCSFHTVHNDHFINEAKYSTMIIKTIVYERSSNMIINCPLSNTLCIQPCVLQNYKPRNKQIYVCLSINKGNNNVFHKNIIK